MGNPAEMVLPSPTVDLAEGCHGRGEARERAILDAALDLVAEVGYDRMSIDALAARARSSKATIYRRWPGKAQVVGDALRRRACPAEMEIPDTGTLRGDLLAAMIARRDSLTGEDADLFIGLLAAARHDPELASALHGQLQDDKAHLAAVIVARAVARGEVPATADPSLIQDIVPPVLITRVVLLRQPTDDAFLAHIVDDVVVPLLATPPSGRTPSPD